MDTRIQFRVDEETKRLAQQMAESQGRTQDLSTASSKLWLAGERIQSFGERAFFPSSNQSRKGNRDS